jgi:hypothetical protein
MIATRGQAPEGFETPRYIHTTSLISFLFSGSLHRDSLAVIFLKAMGLAFELAWRNAKRCDSDYQGTLSWRRLHTAFASYRFVARALIAMHALLPQVRSDLA